jgi:hypothetical protein
LLGWRRNLREARRLGVQEAGERTALEPVEEAPTEEARVRLRRTQVPVIFFVVVVVVRSEWELKIEKQQISTPYAAEE